MTHLIRCRGAVSEIAALFEAKPAGNLSWRPDIWPGSEALVVLGEDRERVLTTLRWGLPEGCYTTKAPLGERTGLFARDLVGGRGARLINPETLTRCLIIVEDVAYPYGPAGSRKRAYAGIWDTPISSWAGVCMTTGDRPGFAGLLNLASAHISPVSPHLPLLLRADGWGPWLAGRSVHDLPSGYEASAWYLEPSDDDWSSGATIGDS